MNLDTSKLTLDEELNGFFQKLIPKDAPNKAAKIRENAVLYFNIGNFGQYIMVFSRYIKYMKDLSSDEMNSFLYKFFIACLMKKNYDMGINDISMLMTTYNQYDSLIYL